MRCRRAHRRRRRDGRGALHPRGHLPRRRPPADAAAPLAAQPRPAGQGDHHRGRDADRPDRRERRRRRRPSTCRAPRARWATTRSPRRWCRSSSTARPERTRRRDGHRPEHPADAGAGEGDLLRRARRGDRAGPADGVPQDAGRRGAARASSSTASPATSRCWPPRSTTRATRRRVRRHSRGFGRIAATTAKQIMLQRLRDAEDDIRYGEFSGKEGDIVSGVIQQGRNPDDVMVDLGKLEALLPMGERAPGERYEHGARIKCLVVSVRKGMRGPQITLSRSHPNLVKKLFALEVPEIADGTVEIAAIAREAGHRTKIAVRSDAVRRQRQGRLHRPDGPAGAQRDGGAARREDRHRRLVRRPRRAGRPRPVPGPGHLRDGRRRRRQVARGSSCPTSSSRWPSARRARTPASPPASPAGASTSARDEDADDRRA